LKVRASFFIHPRVLFYDMKKLGIVTIGQSPRPDVTKEVRRILGGDVEFVEYGALDGLTLEVVRKVKPGPDVRPLVTSMRDGTEVKVTHEFVTPRVQKGIYELEKRGVDLILLLCTGKFPELKSNKIVVMPSEMVTGVVNASLRAGRLGIALPGKEQVRTPSEKRGELEVFYDAASPYGPVEEIEKMARRFAEKKVDLVFLNCMGFDHGMKELVKRITGKPVIQSSAVVARVLQELIE